MPISESKVREILQERERYGPFKDTCLIYQTLIHAWDSALHALGISLEAEHQTSADMIFMKLARMANGDPHYPDNWLDISGYALLNVDGAHHGTEESKRLTPQEDVSGDTPDIDLLGR